MGGQGKRKRGRAMPYLVDKERRVFGPSCTSAKPQSWDPVALNTKPPGVLIRPAPAQVRRGYGAGTLSKNTGRFFFAGSILLRDLISTDRDRSFRDPAREKTRSCFHIFQTHGAIRSSARRHITSATRPPVHPRKVLKAHSFPSGVILSGN